MAIMRMIVDVVVEEPLGERRMETLVKETSDWVHLLGVEVEDGVIEGVMKVHHAHTHVSTYDRACRICSHFAQDEKS